MIHTVSVIKGYTASLGFFFLNLAFFLGALIAVEIPSDKQLAPYGLSNQRMTNIYALQLTYHFLTALVTFLSMNIHWYKNHMENIVQVCSIV